MPYAHDNGFDLYYEASGQGAPVVFVHGGFPSLATTLNDFSQWNWTWENDFAECYRSSAPASGYEVENQARDLAELFAILNVPWAHVIGSAAGERRSRGGFCATARRCRSFV